jgi:hypothetical protein
MKKAVLLLCLTIFLLMPIENWGALQKSATDDETIEEAINRLIAVHEASATSHLGVGESMQNHKSADVIDHPLGSVVGDKISKIDFIFMPTFESLDRYTYSASTITPKLNTVDLFTSSVNNNIAYLYATGASGASNYDPVYKATIQFSLTLFSSSNITVYAGAGVNEAMGGGPFAGFKIVNGTLYGCEGVFGSEGYEEYTTEITGITTNARHNYRVEIDPIHSSLDFYVDGVYKASLVIHANADNALAFFSFSVKTTTTSAKQIRFGQLYFSRDFD